MKKTSDLHIKSITPLVLPSELKAEFPMTEASNATVVKGREAIRDILWGKDERLLAIVGPCSIHDSRSALEYAARLSELSKKLEDRILIVMRVYFEKPRTTVGWRGLIMDPDLDGSSNIAKGLRIARKLLLDITRMGLPVGSEMVDPIVPQYIDDLISWASIGARTTESQTHREMASGLSMPVGFKNGTDGLVDSAVNALSSSRHEHSFIGIDQDGRTCVLKTTGNPEGHIILRGGRTGPNYHEENIERAEELLKKEGLSVSMVIDCSHANSGKKHVRQERVLYSILDQRKRGKSSIRGLMLESNLFEGNQEIPANLSELRYGVSITDECIGWEKTEELLALVYESMSRTGSLPRV